MDLILLWLMLRGPPTRHPAFDLPVDQGRDAGTDRLSAEPPPPGFLDLVWRGFSRNGRGTRIAPA